MSAQDAFKVFRRMWPAALVLGLVSAAVMWMITPVAINTERKVGSFNAVATLLVTAKSQPTQSPTPTPRRRPTPTATATPRGTATPTPTPTPSPTPAADLELAVHRVALLVKTGEVPSRAAESLGYRGDPADLLAELAVAAHAPTGTVTISMKSKESGLAVERVNAFAVATVNYFTNEIGMEGIEVTLLDEATALPNEPTGSFVTPPTRLVRTLVAGGLGVLFGLGLVLLVEALGPRLRSRSAVAMTLGIPVFAEIPTRGRGFGDSARRLVVLETPRGAEADGYRALKSATIHATRRPAVGGETAAGRSGQVVLVTAAGSEAGAAEVTANLAMTIAIDELKVLALDADLRRPGLHEWFDVGDSDGVVGFLGAGPGADLNDYTRPTLMPNVSVLPAGSGGDHPAYWVSQFGLLLDQARTKADVVLLTASPILAASEVFDLVPLADTVLVPVRAGRLLPADARRLAELMARFPHPEAGAVLLGGEPPTKRSRAKR